MTCPSCGAGAPDNARFCPACGHSLVQRPDERRVATVVFADLVGFTTFSESADPEHVKNLVDRCFERLVSDIEAFGGQVDKIVGDAIIALFGAPVAHEDDAERAVRAALKMQETLGLMRDEFDVTAELRIGVNTGEVLVGALRAGGDYTAMGDVVNTAARLQTAAAPGAVIVGPATQAATAESIRYESLGLLRVKGREEPVPAWRAITPLIAPGGRPLRAQTPLVGREAELGMLRSVLATAFTRDRAHLVLMVGEAGVGKSRIGNEIGTVATDEHGALVIGGRCAPYGEANVWWPIAEALRDLLGIDARDSVETTRVRAGMRVREIMDLETDDPEVDRLLDGLLYLLGQTPSDAAVDPIRARDEAVRSTAVLFEALAARRPLMLTISDLHWADELVLDVVDRLLERLRSRPFVLLATSRPDLEDRWTPSAGRHNAIFVKLDPLAADASRLLARAMLGDGGTDGQVELLLERSGGNPFFIEELAAVMVETGLELDAAAIEDRDHALPGTLRGLVAARLDALDPAARETLEDCAVIGTTGSLETVAALAERRGAGRPDSELDLLVGKELLSVDRGEFGFKNELIRDVAYETLTKAERARRHARAVGHLAWHAQQTGRIDEFLDQLAHHYGAAEALVQELGEVEGLGPDLHKAALTFLTRAARQAEQRETWPVVIRLLDLALKVRDGSSDELLLLRARAHAELRHCAEARADLAVVMPHAEAQGDRHIEAAALTVLGDVEQKENELAASAATLERSVQRWRELDDAGGLAGALRILGVTQMFRGALEPAEVAISEARELFRSASERRGEAWALQNLAWISFMRGDPTEADGRVNEAIDMFAEVGDWGGVTWALGMLAWVRFQQGQLDEARTIGERALEEAEDLGNRWMTGILKILLGNVALWSGQPAEALRRCATARELFVELGDGWGELQSIAPTVRALGALGRFDEARVAIDNAARVAARVDDTNFRMLAQFLRAALAAHAGMPDALALTDEAMQPEAGFEGIDIERHTVHALALAQAGRAEDAVEELESTLAAPSANGAGTGAATRAALALAYCAVGRTDDAQATVGRAAPVTYLDRLQLAMAAGLAAARAGQVEAADAAIDGGIDLVDTTESRLDRAVMRLARAWAWQALGRSDAAAARADALHRLEAIGLGTTGWDRLFREAVGA